LSEAECADDARRGLIRINSVEPRIDTNEREWEKSWPFAAPLVVERGGSTRRPASAAMALPNQFAPLSLFAATVFFELL
jgi:hypothetical protein